ncbi:MAG: hypothetical protein ISS48_03860 [Candidatus Aenigmarchaeota archaeon]|nr:hypothetical protein [Candidatus Aenigmarchaeota archaeon]
MTITADRPTTSSGKQYHINLGTGDLVGYVFVPGSPDRVVGWTDLWDSSRILSTKRGLTSASGRYENTNVGACATGMSGGSAAIVINELAAISRDGEEELIRGVIRGGTCASIRPYMHPGDLVVLNGAIGMYDGVTYEYLGKGFLELGLIELLKYVSPRLYNKLTLPSFADKEFTQALIESAQSRGYVLRQNLHVGRSCSTADFFLGQGRPAYNGYMTRKSRKRLRQLQRFTDTLIFEMEASTLFTLATLFGLRVAGICGVVADRHGNEFLGTDEIKELEREIGLVLLETANSLNMRESKS